jgi:transposase
MKEKGCSFYMAKYSNEFKERAVKHFKMYGLSDTLRVYNISANTIYKWERYVESGELMRKVNSKYSVADKLEIINYYRENGKIATEEKYDISSSSFYRWERQLEEYGVEALAKDGRGRPKGPKKDISKNKDLMAELQRLRLENMYLKKLKALVEKREEQENKKK